MKNYPQRFDLNLTINKDIDNHIRRLYSVVSKRHGFS